MAFIKEPVGKGAAYLRLDRGIVREHRLLCKINGRIRLQRARGQNARGTGDGAGSHRQDAVLTEAPRNSGASAAGAWVADRLPHRLDLNWCENRGGHSGVGHRCIEATG